MTDYEEPAAKISKLEVPSKEQEEELEEGQEEWLSEGILTDDDCNQAADRDKSDLNMSASQGDTTPSLPDDDEDAQDNFQDNSDVQDNSQDNSQADESYVPTNSQTFTQDISEHTEDNLGNADASDNAGTWPQENLDNSGTTDDLSTEDIKETQVPDNSQAEDVTMAQDESRASDDPKDNTNAEDNTDVKDNLDAKGNLDAMGNSDDMDNSDVKDNIQAQDSKMQEIAGMKKTLDKDIEQTLDDFENSQQADQPDDLASFLVKKSEKAQENNDGSDLEESPKRADDDGNDTDELLRMLGEDGQKNKKEVRKAEQKRSRSPQSSDDDEYIFEDTKASRLKAAKNSILKKLPTKAVPETVSDRDGDTESSDDEGETMKKMFVSRKRGNFAAKSTSKTPTSTGDSIASVTKKMVTVRRAPEKRPVTSTPLSKLKPEVTITKIRSSAPSQSKETPKKVPGLQKIKEVSKDSVKAKEVKSKAEPEEIIDEDEFLEEEDAFDLEEDFHSEPKQRIMRPERMEEEVLDDSCTDEDEDSLYDEFPSEESDMDEWFTLDVRGERAGEYIPLLGSRAHELLSAEKARVTSRAASLASNVSALRESSQQQAEMLRKATLQLAELDAALKA